LSLAATAAALLVFSLTERRKPIRHITAWDANASVLNPAHSPQPRLMTDKRFREGFAVLKAEAMRRWRAAHPGYYQTPERRKRAAGYQRNWRLRARLALSDPTPQEIPRDYPRAGAAIMLS
jgi:hypothetical protein